jgi:SAM-dependent methyltransferase
MTTYRPEAEQPDLADRVSELESRLIEQEAELRSTKLELQRLTGSLGWRALERYRRVTAWLAPPGTKRRQLYSLLRSVPMALAATGNARVEEVMRREWDERALENSRYYIVTGDWETEEKFERSGESAVAEMLADVDGLLPPESVVLEIGCGIGRMLKPLARRFRFVYGVDVSPHMIWQAKERLRSVKNVEVWANNGRDVEYLKDGEIDGAFSFIVFQHIPDAGVIANYLREIRRVLRSGGVFKFQVHGRPDTLDAAAEELASDKSTWRGVRFTQPEIIRLTENAGLSVLSSYFRPTPGAPPHQYLWVIGRKP